jgi:hypothetical protein
LVALVAGVPGDHYRALVDQSLQVLVDRLPGKAKPLARQLRDVSGMGVDVLYQELSYRFATRADLGHLSTSLK